MKCEREPGIPTVTDRLIQQALLQVLQPLIDPTLGEHSHGFRSCRRARDAVLAAQQYVQAGCRVVVDVDLAQFFERVNHDILIDHPSKRVNDAGAVVERVEGTPQGGSLILHRAIRGCPEPPLAAWMELICISLHSS